MRLDPRYRVLRKLGEGGMGEVYLAHHLELDRDEAIKVLLPQLASDPRFVARFRREARATNRVQHPNIVGMYDFGQLPDGRFYLAMEHVDGQSLSAALARARRFPPGRALHVLWQLADALGHAHALGVLHRDLKPDNLILVEHRGQPDFLKVLDFGIAKIVAPTETLESLTVSGKGEVLGTPEYMAPEIAAGIGDDPRSDLYAAGCIAFEMLVGEAPFLGRTLEILHAHRQKKPDKPSRRRPDALIPPELDAVILRLLEKDPERRIATGAQLLASLREVPGFRDPKKAQRSRSHPSAGDYDTLADTAENLHISSVPTQQLVSDDVQRERRQLLRRLADALIAYDVRDVQLIVGAANLRDIEDRRSRTEAEREELDSQIEKLDLASREREAALRFALAEVRFVRQNDKEPHTNAAQIDGEIAALEEKIRQGAALHERETASLTERAISLAAAHAHLLEELEQLTDGFERLLEELAPRVAGRSAEATTLLGRLRDLRSFTRRRA